MAMYPTKPSKPLDLDAEMKTPTPREQQLADLAEKNKNVVPLLCDITSKNEHALRVVHDFDGKSVAIQPGATRQRILLHPSTVEYLKKGDLTVTSSG